MSKKFSIGELSEKLGFLRRQINALYRTLLVPDEEKIIKGRRGTLKDLKKELARLRAAETRAINKKIILKRVPKRIASPPTQTFAPREETRRALFKKAVKIAKKKGIKLRKNLFSKGADKKFFAKQIKKLKKKRLKKLFNVHIVAEYNIGTPLVEEFIDVDIDLSTRDFTEADVRNRITELREKWEEDQQNIINGETTWVFIRIVSVDIVEIQQGQLANVPMLGTKWNYKLLGDIDKININPGQCVPDYLLYEFSKSGSKFKKMTRDVIVILLGGKKTGYTTNDIITLARTSNYISVHALSPMLEVFEHYKAKEHSRINLCFIVNNSHCYPILDKTFKDQIIYKDKIDLGNFKFNVSYEEHEYYSCESDFLEREENTNMNMKVHLIESSNLLKLAKKVMNQTSSIIQGMKFYYHVLVSFEHPDGYIIESAKDYFLRKEMCHYLYKQYEIPEFVFANQTWATISRNLFKYGFDNIQQSRLSNELEDIYDLYPVGPYMKKLSNIKYNKETCHGFDICKSYTDVLLNNKDNFPVFTALDEVKEISYCMDTIGEDDQYINWVAGEYYINRTIKMANGTIVLNKGFYPLNITRYALKNEYIKFGDITHFIRASTHLEANHFVKFVNYCFSLDIFNDELEEDEKELMASINEDISKSLVNYFTGYLNKKYNIKEKGCITDSYKMACGTFVEENKKGNDCFINKVSDLYIIRSTKKEKTIETSSPIWRHIICGGIMNLDKMHSKLTDEKSIVVSYKVDAIMIKNPKEDYEKEIKTNDNKKIGDITREKWSVSGTSISIDNRPKYVHEEKTWKEKSYDHSDEIFNELKEGSYIVDGISGSGKSTLLSKLIESQPKRKAKVLCFTNKAVDVLKKKGIKDISTFDSIFYNKQTGKKDYRLGIRILSKYDDIYGDEYGMDSWRYMDLLMMLKKAGKNIRLFGDDNQCSPIEEYSPKRDYDYDEFGERLDGLNTYKLYDYKETMFMKNLCDCRYYDKAYMPQYGRYDKKLYKVVKHLLNHETLHKSCKRKVIKDCMMNMAYTNKKCSEINDKCINKFKKNNKGVSITHKEKYWQEGMPVICNTNSKNNKTNRSEQFTIDKINKKKKIIKLKDNNTKFDFNYFTNNFNHGFCITVHRMQGDEITKEYNIYQIWMMNKELLYTAIGRGKKFNNVHFEYNSSRFYKERIFRGSVEIKPKPEKITKEMKENNKKEEKPEPIIQIVQDVYVNKSIQKFNIIEGKDSYIINYTEKGKKKQKKVCFGKKTTKKKALKRITKIREKLIK